MEKDNSLNHQIRQLEQRLEEYIAAEIQSKVAAHFEPISDLIVDQVVKKLTVQKSSRQKNENEILKYNAVLESQVKIQNEISKISRNIAQLDKKINSLYGGGRKVTQENFKSLPAAGKKLNTANGKNVSGSKKNQVESYTHKKSFFRKINDLLEEIMSFETGGKRYLIILVSCLLLFGTTFLLFKIADTNDPLTETDSAKKESTNELGKDLTTQVDLPKRPNSLEERGGQNGIDTTGPVDSQKSPEQFNENDQSDMKVHLPSWNDCIKRLEPGVDICSKENIQSLISLVENNPVISGGQKDRLNEYKEKIQAGSFENDSEIDLLSKLVYEYASVVAYDDCATNGADCGKIEDLGIDLAHFESIPSAIKIILRNRFKEYSIADVPDVESENFIEKVATLELYKNI